MTRMNEKLHRLLMNCFEEDKKTHKEMMMAFSISADKKVDEAMKTAD